MEEAERGPLEQLVESKREAGEVETTDFAQNSESRTNSRPIASNTGLASPSVSSSVASFASVYRLVLFEVY